MGRFIGTGSVDRARVADVLIIGSGAAGLSVALAMGRSRRVVVLSKTAFATDGASVQAQGGVAAALGVGDSPARHAGDTVSVGAGLCDPEIVRLVTEDGPERIAELLRLGARFDWDGPNQLALGREAAHSCRRVVRAAGDATGQEVMRTLSAALATVMTEEHGEPGVCVDQGIHAEDLVVRQGRVHGVLAQDAMGQSIVYVAPVVVLATGGIGQVFSHTTNPVGATADGLAMAARAGARLAGLEFVQFHPTALAVGRDPMPLLTEALRGEGARLVDERGDHFVERVHPLAELAPRDVLARAIWRHRMQGHDTLMDATSLADGFMERFPTVFSVCQAHGIDPRQALLPVAPAAHYHMGGVWVNAHGRTSIDGLLAVGEVAHTGLHGANRLASNSLLEALVFGARVGRMLKQQEPPSPNVLRTVELAPALSQRARPSGEDANANTRHQLRRLMWRRVGLKRSAAGLTDALDCLRSLTRDAALTGSLRNMATAACLVARAALARGESRGSHYRIDCAQSQTVGRTLLPTMGGLTDALIEGRGG